MCCWQFLYVLPKNAPSNSSPLLPHILMGLRLLRRFSIKNKPVAAAVQDFIRIRCGSSCGSQYGLAPLRHQIFTHWVESHTASWYQKATITLLFFRISFTIDCCANDLATLFSFIFPGFNCLWKLASFYALWAYSHSMHHGGAGWSQLESNL